MSERRRQVTDTRSPDHALRPAADRCGKRSGSLQLAGRSGARTLGIARSDVKGQTTNNGDLTTQTGEQTTHTHTTAAVTETQKWQRAFLSVLGAAAAVAVRAPSFTRIMG